MKYLVANWKSNKNETGANDWFKTIADLYQGNKEKKFDNLEIVVCPPFVYLPLANNLIKTYKLPFKLGAQNVSPYAEGAYTGEVTAKMIREFAEYVIIGHSERRKYFQEDETIVDEKIKKAKEVKLEPILCVAKKENIIPSEATLVAYEPVEAIGSGQPETPENASEMATFLKQKDKQKKVFYGGSVKPINVVQYLTAANIDGVLVGGASLEAVSFWEMIINASDI